jgi:hypothetical protein
MIIFQKMSGSLYQIISNKTTFPKLISDVAKMIQLECGVSDWQKATQEQLSKRDRIHENIALLTDVLKDIPTAVRIGVEKSK